MKFLIAVLCALLVSPVFAADEYKHLITVDAGGLGWSGVANIFDVDKDKTGIKDYETTSTSLNLNYKYIFRSGWMLGATLAVENDKTERKDVDGDKFKNENKQSLFGIIGGYNFSENLSESWWITATLAGGSVESKTEETGAATEKVDGGLSAFILEVGKRFSLEGFMGLKHVTYSPSIEFASFKFDDDYEDAGLDKASGVAINFLRFDILF